MSDDRPTIDAAVLIARCSKTSGVYGIRVEAGNDDWHSTWAFPIDSAERATREHGAPRQLTGTFAFTPDWPGCPRCRARSWTTCSACRRIGCWDERPGDYQCPWCAHRFPMTSGGTGSKFSIDARKD